MDAEAFAELFAGEERPPVQQSDECVLLKRAKYSHNRIMKRNSKQRFRGTIAKRTAPKVSLSILPTDILSQILSRLAINDAVRTSVLSREWKYVSPT